jgi:NAD(P)-dependent dehydrogenase (short-subunit alcohol dehydrogenase family)
MGRMELDGKTVVVTGAGHGIGRGLAERFLQEGARQVVVSDIDEDLLRKAATALDAPSYRCDVGDPEQLAALIDHAEREVGPVDLFVSNAAYGFTAGRQGSIHGGLDTTEEVWDATWQVNVMAHVRAARQLVPAMLGRGGGYFLFTVSAAGLITSNSPVAYTVTKHADIGFAEWLALNYGRRGIGVSCLCPTAVATREGQFDEMEEIGLVQTPADVAQYVVDGLRAETFLILPNPAVGGSFRKKAQDYDAWIARTQMRLEGMGHLPPPDAGGTR